MKTLEELIAYNVASGLPESVARADAALSIAKSNEDELKYRVDTEARAAAAAVTASYYDQLSELARLRRDAEQIANDAKIADTNKDNRVGQRVSKWGYARTSIWDRNPPKVHRFGTIEVRTHNTVFPANQTWLPAIGHLFVRLEKKNGTPSLRFDNHVQGWEPVEE